MLDRSDVRAHSYFRMEYRRSASRVTEMLSLGPHIVMPDQGRERKPTRRRRKTTGFETSRKSKAAGTTWDLWARFGTDWLFGLASDGAIVWASLAAQSQYGS